MSAFNAVKYKETTREQWQSRRQGVARLGSVSPRLARPGTEVMLDMARVGPGSRVLDVAAGAGEQTCRRRNGSARQATCLPPTSRRTSWSSPPQKPATPATQRRDPVMDGEKLDVPEETFDAVISRVGLIYFPDQQKALAGMQRALKPGGRVAAIVYSTAESNRFFSIPVSIIRRRAALPPPLPGQPGPFSLGGPGVLEDAFRGRIP